MFFDVQLLNPRIYNWWLLCLSQVRTWISYLICHGLVYVQSGIEGERSLDIFCIGINFLFLIQIENFSGENVQPSVNEQSLSFKVTTSTPRVHDIEMCWVMGLTSPSTVYLLYHCGNIYWWVDHSTKISTDVPRVLLESYKVVSNIQDRSYHHVIRTQQKTNTGQNTINENK
jgi:hypothetical protein